MCSGTDTSRSAARAKGCCATSRAAAAAAEEEEEAVDTLRPSAPTGACPRIGPDDARLGCLPPPLQRGLLLADIL